MLRPGLALYGLVPRFDPAFGALPIRLSPATQRQPSRPRSPPPAPRFSPSSPGKPRSPASAQFRPAQPSATTGPSSPPNPCASRSSPQATATASTARSAIVSAFWCAASARRSSAASAWIRLFSMSRRFPASSPATKSSFSARKAMRNHHRLRPRRSRRHHPLGNLHAHRAARPAHRRLKVCGERLLRMVRRLVSSPKRSRRSFSVPIP